MDGETRHLPDSVGGQAGIAYSIGPEVTLATSVSLHRTSSPFQSEPGRSVGYLSQSVVYRRGGTGYLRGSVDVGLTEDSLDAVFGLTLQERF